MTAGKHQLSTHAQGFGTVHAACRFHNANWKAIADESVQVINRFGQQDASVYQRAGEQSRFAGEDRRWLISLFNAPIKIEGGSYNDGQHRGCALRFSGAAQAAVVVRTNLVEQRCADWHYQGDG